FTIEPNGYLVITPDPTVEQQHYYCKYPENMIKANVPSMNDDAGNVLLLNTQGVVFDEFVYSDKMHVPLLDDKDGVSLERIDFNRATNDQTNWTSAAAAVNYATPTYRNSQYLNTERSENVFELQPKTISPDGDGYEDVMNINYLINDNGYTGTLTIYNAAGQEVKQLFKNSLLAPNGTYTWDGTTNSGQKAPVGLYVFYFEIFNLNGDVKSYKTVGVVAAKL
nr:gliding motility-associated C-terminal domain-containing protein [Bacteroidia bacterium]